MKVIVNSYPKSGSNFIKYLLFAAIEGEFLNSRQVQNFFPSINFLRVEDLLNNEASFFKSHHPYSTGKEFLGSIDKVIFLVRNPLDILASRKNHYLTAGDFKLLTKNGSLKFYTEQLSRANDKDGSNDISGGWNYHVSSWIDAELSQPLFVVKYESLLLDTIKTLSSIFDFLEINITKEQLIKAKELSHIDKVRDLERKELVNRIPGQYYNSEKRYQNFIKTGTTRVNVGKVDNYKSVLPEQTIKEGQIIYNDLMKRLGYI